MENNAQLVHKHPILTLLNNNASNARKEGYIIPKIKHANALRQLFGTVKIVLNASIQCISIMDSFNA